MSRALVLDIPDMHNTHNDVCVHCGHMRKEHSNEGDYCYPDKECKFKAQKEYACHHYGENGTPDRVCPQCYAEQQMKRR